MEFYWFGGMCIGKELDSGVFCVWHWGIGNIYLDGHFFAHKVSYTPFLDILLFLEYTIDFGYDPTQGAYSPCFFLLSLLRK